MELQPASVREAVGPSVRPSTISNMAISKTSGPIAIKFNLKHHWDGRKPALGFVLDQIRTLVSMASDSSHKVIVRKMAPSSFIRSSSFLQVRRTTINERMSSKFGQIGSWTAELAAFERLKNP